MSRHELIQYYMLLLLLLLFLFEATIDLFNIKSACFVALFFHLTLSSTIKRNNLNMFIDCLTAKEQKIKRGKINIIHINNST